MVSEIWSAKDRIFCHFGPFFALLPSPPPMDQENQIFEKMRKTSIISQMCTIHENHIMYGF